MELFPIFITGLFVGGLTCLAVQGGLLASTIAQGQGERLKNEMLRKSSIHDALPIISFLAAKLIAYTILGFLLGWFGSLFQLSITTQVILQFVVVIFMLGTALNILEVHPIFRYFIIQPPRFLTRLVRNESKSKSFFAPAILGAFTVFIPCGTTQAMMALAIASGNPLLGAAIMFVFTLGTSPVFFTLGFLATKLGEALRMQFMRLAAYAIILLALFNFNNILALSGSTFTFDRAFSSFICTISFCSSSVLASNLVSNDVTINIEGLGYTPNNFSVKAGANVTLRLKNIDGYGCTQAFTIPSLGIQKIVPLGSSGTIEFKAPEKPTQLAFSCSMGMYRGVINVL